MILMVLELGGAALRRSDHLGEGASCEKIWSMMLMMMMTMIASSFPGVCNCVGIHRHIGDDRSKDGRIHLLDNEVVLSR